ncbi:MAG: AMP-binding protein, partial [bacterium]
VIRDPSHGKNLNRMRELILKYKPEYINAVPVTMIELKEQFGIEILSSFQEGIVGGAPLNENHSRVLNQTSLRVGYGQTEASPGITLGETGHFEPGLLGQPVGCEMRIENQSEMEFRGLNSHSVKYDLETGDITRFTTPRWIKTGDLGRKKDETYYFDGRKDYRTKLPNGKFLHPRKFERKIINELSQVEKVFIRSNKNSSLTVYVSTSQEQNSLMGSTRSKIYELVPYVSSILEVSSDVIQYDKKGAVNRDATVEVLEKRNILV